jgi:hypothetical protein
MENIYLVWWTIGLTGSTLKFKQIFISINSQQPTIDLYHLSCAQRQQSKDVA